VGRRPTLDELDVESLTIWALDRSED